MVGSGGGSSDGWQWWLVSLLRVFLPRARPNTARARSLVGETGGVVYLLGLNDLDGDDHDCVVNSDIFVFAHQLKRHWSVWRSSKLVGFAQH